MECQKCPRDKIELWIYFSKPTQNCPRNVDFVFEFIVSFFHVKTGRREKRRLGRNFLPNLQSCQGKSYKIVFFLRFFANIFLLMCRMITIFLLTQRARLSGPFRYLEHVRKANKKFSRGLWKKVSAQKMGFCQNIPTRFWASFFQNLNFFHFSWHKIWLVRRAFTIFYWRKDLG